MHYVPVATDDPKTGATLTRQKCTYSIPPSTAGYCECTDNVPRFVYPGHGLLNCNFLCGTKPQGEATGAWAAYDAARRKGEASAATRGAAGTAKITLVYGFVIVLVVLCLVVLGSAVALKSKNLKTLRALEKRLGGSRPM